MKIMLVIPTLKQGGAERVMSELANAFSNKGEEIHLCLLVDSEDFYKLNENVVVHRMGFRYSNKLGKVVSEVSLVFRLRKLIVRQNPDVILSFMTRYNMLTLVSSFFTGMKVFVSDRSNPNAEIGFLERTLRKCIYRYAAGIIAQTLASKSWAAENTKNENIQVIPNPLKTVKSLPEIKKEKIILTVGRLVPEKGQIYLLEVFALLKLKDWKLVIVGDGPLRQDIERKAADLGITDNLELAGEVADVDLWFARSSIFAFPSISEGFPNALIEAMASGLPCVSFDCETGPREVIVDGENGFLVETGDVRELGLTLSKLVASAELRVAIGTNAASVRKSYNSEVIANQYLEFLKN